MMMAIRMLATTLIMKMSQFIETPVSKLRRLSFKLGTAQYGARPSLPRSC